MNRRKHVIAMTLCIVMILSVFVSSAYIVRETIQRHDCAGEDCPICQFIAQIEQLRRSFATVLLSLLLICFALAVGHEWRARAMAEEVPALCTLVGCKIRLND